MIAPAPVSARKLGDLGLDLFDVSGQPATDPKALASVEARGGETAVKVGVISDLHFQGRCAEVDEKLLHVGPFLTIGPANASAVYMAYKYAIYCLSTGFFATAENSRFCSRQVPACGCRAMDGGAGLSANSNRALCVSAGRSRKIGLGSLPSRLAPTCDRSSAVGAAGRDAVRDRTLAPWPRRQPDLGDGSPPLPPSPSLTPARWSASKLAGQSGAPIGSWVVVPDGTRWNHAWNRQVTENTSLFSRFQRFRALASRDAHAPVCTITRAYTRGEIRGTMEPLEHIVMYQVVSGSKCGSIRFHVGTCRLIPRQLPDIAGFQDILGTGYCDAGRTTSGRQLLAGVSTVMRGSGGETFGFSRGAAGGDRRPGRVDRAGSMAATRARQSARFPGVSARRSGHVGRVMLEGCTYDADPARFFRPAHKPFRLAHGSRHGADRPGRGGHAPFAPSPSPSTTALERGQIWNGFQPDLSRRGSADREVAQTRDGGDGSGCGARIPCRWRAAGRGVVSIGLSVELRRNRDASGRAAHVN